MYVTLCCLHGKAIRTKYNLKVAFSLNSWIYNKKVIIQLTVQYGNIVGLVPRCLYHIGRSNRRGSHLGTCPNIFRYCTVNCIITYKERHCFVIKMYLSSQSLREPHCTANHCVYLTSLYRQSLCISNLTAPPITVFI